MLARAFGALRLFERGARVDAAKLREVADAISNEVASLGDEPQTVLLAEVDPLRFSIAFFSLLDRRHVPIAVGGELSPFQRARYQAMLPHAVFFGGASEPRGPSAEARALAPHGGGYGCLTSGTTGPEALRLLTTSGARENARVHAASLGIRAASTLLQALPLHHSFGLVAYLFTAIETGAALDLSPTFLTFRTLRKRALEEAVLHVSPAQARFLLREGGPPPTGLSVLSVGGALLDPEELERLRLLAPDARLYVTYGLTEAGPRVTTGRVDGPVRRGFVGHALAGIQLGVLVSGESKAFGRGELTIRTPSRSVERDGERPSNALVTRDLVDLTEDGEVFFIARGDDLLKIGGVSVYPAEIESVARTHPSVRDAMAFGASDPIYEHVALLVVESDVQDLDLGAFLAERLPPSHRPRQIFVIPELPRSTLGKVDRSRVREWINDARVDSASQPPRP